MTERATGSRLLLVLALALTPVSASAVGKTVGPKRPPPTLAKYVSDLTAENAAKRSYAGRVLARQVKAARRDAAHGSKTDLTRAAAMAKLTDFDQLVAPVCSRHLAVVEITGACADILGYLETQSALPALRAQLALETRGRIKSRIARAIARIEAVAK